MWWRAPWLQQRWTLLGLALLDAALLVGNYNLLFWYRFERWAGVTGSLAIAAIIWLMTSYTMGRYSQPDEISGDSALRRSLATTCSAAVVLCVVVVVANWGLGSNDPRSFRGFVMPVLGSTLIGSTLGQEITRSRTPIRREWQLVASDQELAVIDHELNTNPPAQPIAVRFTSDGTRIGKWNLVEPRRKGFAIGDSAGISEEEMEDILINKSKGASACSLATWCEVYLQRIPPELFSRSWLAQAEGFELQPGRMYWRIKRFGDIFAGTLLLVAGAPLMAAAAIAIALEDRGPILYSQIRTGIYGEPFRIWKLRSMRVKAESRGAEWSKRGDVRITRVGHWLRQLRIDELPQLISVLKGEMSLIGPRPERPDIEADLERVIPHYRVRHWVRPGLSGWAQVCFPYGASIEDSRA